MKSKSSVPVKCKDCLYRIKSSSDAQTGLASLGFRFVYSILTWGILGKGIIPGSGFFVSLCLFVAPVCIDYLKYKPDEHWRKVLKAVFLMITGVIFVFSVFGLFNIFDVVEINNLLVIQVSEDYIVFSGSHYAVRSVWYFVGMSIIFVTFVDWIATARKNETILGQRVFKGTV